MAGGGNFMNRVVSYLVNELLVDSLANSRAFQRFAVKTSKRIEDIQNIAAKKREQLAEQMNGFFEEHGRFIQGSVILER